MIAALVLGGLAGADRTAFAQTMLAHPIVCGTLAGWWAGDPESGLRLGLVLGMLASRRAPIGGDDPVIDWTSAAVAVPVGLGASASGWQWGMGILAGLAVALAGGRLIRGVRVLASRREARVEQAALRGDLGTVERTHLTFLAAHLLRGAVVAAIGAWGVATLAYDLAWSGPEQSALAMIWAFAPVVAVVVLVDGHARRTGWRPVLAGAAAAGVLLALAAVAA